MDSVITNWKTWRPSMSDDLGIRISLEEYHFLLAIAKQFLEGGATFNGLYMDNLLAAIEDVEESVNLLAVFDEAGPSLPGDEAVWEDEEPYFQDDSVADFEPVNTMYAQKMVAAYKKQHTGMSASDVTELEPLSVCALQDVYNQEQMGRDTLVHDYGGEVYTKLLLGGYIGLQGERVFTTEQGLTYLKNEDLLT